MAEDTKYYVGRNMLDTAALDKLPAAAAAVFFDSVIVAAAKSGAVVVFDEADASNTTDAAVSASQK